MMKRFLFLTSAMLCCAMVFAQTELLLVGQTFGQQEMHDGEQLFIHGFADDYGQDLFVQGPTLYMTAGDSVIIDFHNMSMIPHTVHLHGLDVNQENDGVPQTSYIVEHMDHGYYHMTVPHPGTYIYHCHYVSSIHVQSGMYGFVVVYPESGEGTTWDDGFQYDHDFEFMTFEFDSDWHTFDILNQTMEDMVVLPDYNPEYFMINGYSEQQLEENGVGVNVQFGEVAHLRFCNMGFYGNLIHFPSSGMYEVISSDGRPLANVIDPDSLWVMPGERYDVLFSSQNIGEESIEIAFVDMNTGVTHDTQSLPVTVEEETGIDDQEIEISIFPVPAQEFVIIDLESNAAHISHYQLIDTEGRIVLNDVLRNNQNQLNISGLTSGVYVLNVFTSSGIISKRLIVE